MTFDSLGLRAELLRALGDAGYTIPTPVQAQAIPVILQGHDILAGAQTGTGKTAGFTLPLLQRLAAAPARPNNSASRRPVRALILTPTRELAAQVEESVRTYGKYLPLTATVVFGGVNINPQIGALRRGVDILVATPGRLLDHVQQRTVDLSRVEILVLDEADRMLDMGFIRDIKRILALLPPGTNRQNLLFSATFSNEIKALADSLLNKPVLVEVARRNAESELVTQSVYHATKESKRDLLVHLLVEEKVGQALVFTRTKHGADRLAKQLHQDGIVAVPIHGNRSQSQRTRALADFKAGAARILVATDIAARGLDIEQLPHVFNYELPNVPEDYVHRIGRTGRAGSTGEAISLVSPDEQSYLADIEKLIKKRIARREVTNFTPKPHAAPLPFEERERERFVYNTRPGGSGGGNGRSNSSPNGNGRFTRPYNQAPSTPRPPSVPRPARPGNVTASSDANRGRRPAPSFSREPREPREPSNA
ncbi:MAG: DEAD/DEAH box helicase [Cytophagales bacterium]|nr:DEAD/DEAH box helicase [Armatimonadota bacterium]